MMLNMSSSEQVKLFFSYTQESSLSATIDEDRILFSCQSFSESMILLGPEGVLKGKTVNCLFPEAVDFWVLVPIVIKICL